MSESVTKEQFAQTMLDAVINPWLYIGAEAGLATVFASNTLKVFDDIAIFADEVRGELLSEAQKFQKAELFWRQLSAELSAELDGLRGRLNTTAQVWADKATDALQNSLVLDDIQHTKSPEKLLTAVSEMSRMLGGMVAAAQLVAELNKETTPTGPAVEDVAKAALGIAAGVLVTLLAGTTLPAVAIGVVVGIFVDVAWDAFAKEGLSTEFKTASFWDVFFDFFSGRNVSGIANSSFNSARAVVLQRDPLVLDLDGDGLELSAASANTLFDHNADGIKTGTGWARPDDGFLVRDLNGNGSIDSGRELFGVDTVKSNGQLATQGFDALADLDSNGDGQITSADAAWGQLQVWRDVNQDGISQAGELSALDALGITRIGLNGSSTGPQAGQTINNNRVALSTTFTRNGVTRTVGAIDLEANGFFSQIPPEVVDEQGNPVVISEGALALPQMNGSGMVRSLRANQACAVY